MHLLHTSRFSNSGNSEERQSSKLKFKLLEAAKFDQLQSYLIFGSKFELSIAELPGILCRPSVCLSVGLSMGLCLRIICIAYDVP